jgi:hypothetical protein
MPEGATMPGEGAGGPYYIRIDALVEQLGEDIFRFLDGPLDPLPRIRGLETVAECCAWKAGEYRIQRYIRNEEPRERIIAALEQREAYLESYEPDPDFERDVPEKTVLLQGEPYDEVDRGGALENLRSKPVATDGG